MPETQSSVNLPVALREGLEGLALDVSQQTGDRLVSVVLYGDPAKGEPIDVERTSIPVMIVLKDASVETLSEIAGSVHTAMRKHNVAPFVLSENDLRSSTDVFPVKFLDMQSSHVLLAGDDLLSELEISTEHLRLRCEQELRNLTLRLRNVFLRAESDENLRRAISDAVPAFFNMLGAILTLKTGLAPVGRQATVDDAAKQLDVDRELLDSVRTLRPDSNSVSGHELRTLLGRFVNLVESLAGMMDVFEHTDATGD